MFPIPGVDLAVVDDEGNTLPLNQKGYLVIRKPWPGMLMTLWNDDDKYKNNYWKKNYYFAGDYAIIDDEHYFWILGRSDDVIKVSGHRLGTIELENTFISHPSIAEAAVTSKPDKIKGESIIAFLVLKKDFVASEQLRKELIDHIRKNIGAIATINEIYFVNKLPKTRSGKIMRRLLKSIVSGLTIGDTTTLEDGTSIQEIQKIYDDLNGIINK
jgi:acetyl-CoA synthetase